jgi:predicted PurR-regulated permease PerM
MQTIEQPQQRKPFTFDRVVRMIITIVVVIAAIWIINRLKGVLLPFLVAWLIAYILEPFVQFNRRVFRLKGRVVAILITLIGAIALVSLLGYIFIPSIIDEFYQMADIIKRYAVTQTHIEYIPQGVQDFLRKTIDFKTIGENMTRQDVQSIINTTFKLVSNSFDLLLSVLGWFIVVLYLVFIMLDYEKLLKSFRRMIPPKHRETTLRVLGDIQDSMNHYFRGQSLVALCVGILFAIGFSIIGLPMGIVLGLFIGLLNLVPYLQLISLVPTTVLCIVCSVDSNISFWNIWLECMAVYIIVQAIQDLILTPKIMGKYLGLNPAIILLSLSIWGSLLGFIGLIIALPTTTLLIAYYDRFINGDNK